MFIGGDYTFDIKTEYEIGGSSPEEVMYLICESIDHETNAGVLERLKKEKYNGKTGMQVRFRFHFYNAHYPPVITALHTPEDNVLLVTNDNNHHFVVFNFKISQLRATLSKMPEAMFMASNFNTGKPKVFHHDNLTDVTTQVYPEPKQPKLPPPTATIEESLHVLDTELVKSWSEWLLVFDEEPRTSVEKLTRNKLVTAIQIPTASNIRIAIELFHCL